MTATPVADHVTSSALPMTATIGALGVVYGDIGTSPLYAIDQIFFGPAGVAPTPDNVLGAISLAIWTIILIVAIKYALLVLRAGIIFAVTEELQVG